MSKPKTKAQKYIETLPIEECPFCKKPRSVIIGERKTFILTTPSEQSRMLNHWQDDYDLNITNGRVLQPFRLIPAPQPERVSAPDALGKSTSDYSLLVSCHTDPMMPMPKGFEDAKLPTLKQPKPQ
jgi:hypothetical protein